MILLQKCVTRSMSRKNKQLLVINSHVLSLVVVYLIILYAFPPYLSSVVEDDLWLSGGKCHAHPYFLLYHYLIVMLRHDVSHDLVSNSCLDQLYSSD